jgi:hypothetical protein
MWALLSRRLRRWLLLVVAAPVAAKVLHRVADGLESSRGESTVTKGLRKGADLAGKTRGRRRGPLR